MTQDKNMITVLGTVIEGKTWVETFARLAQVMKENGLGDYTGHSFKTEDQAYTMMSMLHLRLEELEVEYFYNECLDVPED